jgi:iron complex outermembrane receptor protein
VNKIISIILFLLLVLNHLYSQDFFPPDSVNILKEVPIHAKRKLDLTGSKVIKLDSLVIEQKSKENLSELLSENSTVFIKSHGKGSLATASFRGTNASHTKVSWNNVNLNSPAMGTVDLSQIPLIITDDVTIYHGAASLNRNNNALGGLIELNTKTDWKKGIRLKLISAAGSFSTFDELLEIKAGNKKIQSASKIYYNYSKNDFSFYNNDITDGNKEKRKNADYSKKGFEQELFFRINSSNIISVKGWIQDSDRGVPGLTTNESGLNNNINREKYHMLVYSAEYLNIQEKSRFELHHGGNYHNSDYLSKNFINGVGYLKVIDSEGKSFSAYNSASYKYNLGKQTEISARLNFNVYDVNSFEKIRAEGYDTTRYEGGLTISLYTSIIKKLRLGILVKQDFYNKKLTPFVPSFFSEYYITQHLILKASVARNYNLPGLNDLYYVPGGNPDLLPEKGFSTDGGIQSVISGKKYNLRSEISINYSNIKDWILWRPTAMGYWTPDNIEKVIAYGTDINFNLNINFAKIRLNAVANYSYTRSKNMSEKFGENDNSIGKQLPYIPVHSANLFSQIEFRKFFFSYQWNYYSERYTTSAAEPGLLTSIYPYFMNNIGIGKELIYKDYFFRLSFNIYNLFNESYRSVLWQPMPGINYSVQLTIKFR